jgi:F-type H+-transporting ATPase subunit epsilon
VLYNHAPLISSLVAGTISFTADEKENAIDILGGFVEVKNNCVTACVEIK